MLDEQAHKLYQALILVGLSQPYASQISTGKREPSLPLSIEILDKTGWDVGPMAGRTKHEIKVLREASELLYT